MNEIFETLYKRFPQLAPCSEDIASAFELLKKCVGKGTVLVCGNGGSAADSEHIVGELMKGFNLKRPLTQEDIDKFEGDDRENIAKKLQYGIRAISLVSQAGVISAYANDCDPSLIFAQQVFAYAQNENDVLIALSTSGNSLNIVNAVKAAKAAGIKAVAITGAKESKLSKLADVTVRLPAGTPFEVQEYTLPVYHALCAGLEAEFFTE